MMPSKHPAVAVNDTNACLRGLFEDIKKLYHLVIHDLAMQFRENANLPAMQEMASIILGEDLFDEKLTQIFQLENPQVKQKPNIHVLVMQLQQDLQKKEVFFKTYLQDRNIIDENSEVTGNRKSASPVRDQVLQKETVAIYKKFIEYTGKKSAVDINLAVPKELRDLFCKDQTLCELETQYNDLLQKNQVEIFKPLQESKKTKSNTIQHSIEQSSLQTIAKTKSSSAAMKLPTHVEEAKPLELTEAEKDSLQCLIKSSEAKSNHSQRLQLLKRAHKKLTGLKGQYNGLMVQYRARDDIRKFEAQFKDFIKLFLPDQPKPWETYLQNSGDLLKWYDIANTEISQAIMEMGGRYRNLDMYKAAMADIRTSQLDRDKIINKFEDIQFKNKIHLQKEMLIGYKPVADDIDGIIRGGLLRQNQHLSMHDYFREVKDNSDFIEESTSSSALWNQICGMWAGAAAGTTAGAGAYALSSTVMSTTGSLAMGVLVGTAFGSASSKLWLEKKGLGEQENSKLTQEHFDAAMLHTFGKDLIKTPELQELSARIERLMHFRTCLLENKNKMRTDYLHRTGLDLCKPKLTNAQINQAIEVFFAKSIIDAINESVIMIYELNQENIEQDGVKKSLFRRGFDALFGEPPSVEDQHRFTELMVEGLVENIIRFCMHKTEEKGFLARNPKIASALGGLIFGLVTAFAALAVCAALLIPPGGVMLTTAAIAFVVPAIPGTFLTFHFKNLFGKYSLAHSADHNRGLRDNTIRMLSEEKTRMESSIAKKKGITIEDVNELAKFAEHKEEYKADGSFSSFADKIIQTFQNKSSYGMGTTDGWFRQLNQRFRTSKLVQNGLQPELKSIEEQATKQISQLQASLLTGHLLITGHMPDETKNYKPLFDYVKHTRAFLEKWRNNKMIAKFRLKEMLREEVLQIVAVAGIRDANNDAAPITIPPFLKDFYTKDLGGAEDDLRTVRAMAKIELLLPQADKLKGKLETFPLTVLAGSDLYRPKLGLAKFPKGLILARGTNPDTILTETNVTEFLENSYQFLLSLDTDEEERLERPVFKGEGSEYTHTKQYTLYKTLLLKKLAELVDPTLPGFKAGVSHQVIRFIQKKWYMKLEDVEEMLLQIQHQEFITEESKKYSLIEVDASLSPTTEQGLKQLRIAANDCLPAYVLFGEELYLLDEAKNPHFLLKVTPEKLDAFRHVFRDLENNAALNKVQRYAKLSTILQLETLMEKRHDSAVTDAIRVNLAFGLPKMTPEQILRQVIGDAFYIDNETQLEKFIFLVNRQSLDDLHGPESESYGTSTIQCIQETERFIEKILENIASFKDTDAPEIYIHDLKKTIQDLIRDRIDMELEAAAQHQPPAEEKGVNFENPLAMAKAALQLHLANLDLYEAKIAIAKLQEPLLPNTITPARNFLSFFRSLGPVAAPPRCLSEKEMVLQSLTDALTQNKDVLEAWKNKQPNQQTVTRVTLDRDKTIQVQGLTGIARPMAVGDILGDRPCVHYAPRLEPRVQAAPNPAEHVQEPNEHKVCL